MLSLLRKNSLSSRAGRSLAGPGSHFADFVLAGVFTSAVWPFGLPVLAGVGVNLSKPKLGVKSCLRKYLGMVKIQRVADTKKPAMRGLVGMDCLLELSG